MQLARLEKRTRPELSPLVSALWPCRLWTSHGFGFALTTRRFECCVCCEYCLVYCCRRQAGSRMLSFLGSRARQKDVNRPRGQHCSGSYENLSTRVARIVYVLTCHGCWPRVLHSRGSRKARTRHWTGCADVSCGDLQCGLREHSRYLYLRSGWAARSSWSWKERATVRSFVETRRKRHSRGRMCRGSGHVVEVAEMAKDRQKRPTQWAGDV